MFVWSEELPGETHIPWRTTAMVMAALPEAEVVIWPKWKPETESLVGA